MNRKLHDTMHRLGGLLLIIGIFGMAVGCAATSVTPIADPLASESLAAAPRDHNWWAIRFAMEREQGVTRWEKDLLIAHRIIAPLIPVYRDEIALWRFHRRSAEDAKGHQFSFIFFASAQTAAHINRHIQANPMVEQLLASRTVVAVLTDSGDHRLRPEVGDTSDPRWSALMQANWPYFIMGVSRMWLGMIDQTSQEVGSGNPSNTEQLLAHYSRVNQKVTQIWQTESYHALLHHLNAIFGYEAMIFTEKSWKSF